MGKRYGASPTRGQAQNRTQAPRTDSGKISSKEVFELAGMADCALPSTARGKLRRTHRPHPVVSILLLLNLFFNSSIGLLERLF